MTTIWIQVYSCDLGVVLTRVLRMCILFYQVAHLVGQARIQTIHCI